MAVPAHDERDFQFWKKYHRESELKIRCTNSAPYEHAIPNGIIFNHQEALFEKYAESLEPMGILPAFLLFD